MNLTQNKPEPKPEYSLEHRHLRHHTHCGREKKEGSTHGLRGSNMPQASHGIKYTPQKPPGEEIV